MKYRFPSFTLLLGLVLVAALLAVAACPSPAFAAATTAQVGKTFPTPEVAVDALVAALRQNDEAALRAVLGPGSEGLIHSGDEVADREQREKFLAAYDAKHALAADALGRMVLSVGADDWPLPMPIVQSTGKWHFDSQQGAQDLVDRRIGRNEIAAIRTALAYVDAQKLYFEMMRQVGAGEYAQRLLSTPGKRDGLYWPAAEGETASPLAPLIEQAEEEGYPGANVSGKPIPYHGYFFRILRGQGNSAPSGAMDYMSDGHMTKGFALIAWPATYGVSGVMTFEVNQDGIVFQKDLGERTATVAAGIKRFDPDLSWARIDISD